MIDLYRYCDIAMGYKKCIELLEKIQDEGLTDELKEQALKEIKKFYDRKGNAEMILNSF